MSDETNTGMSDQTNARVSRRTLAKGIAWSVPAAAAFAAAPAYAASPGCVITFGAGSCKCPGQSTDEAWGYYVRLCSSGSGCDPNNTGSLWVAIRANTGQNPILAGPYSVPVNGCTAVIQFNSTNSAGKLNLHYGATAEAASSPSAPFSQVDTPPNCESGDLGNCSTTTSTTTGTTTEESTTTEETTGAEEESKTTEEPTTNEKSTTTEKSTPPEESTVAEKSTTTTTTTVEATTTTTTTTAG